jgi:hypothetical protein
MKVQITPDELRVELSPAEKLLSLHGDIVVPRSSIVAAEVDEDPLGTYASRPWSLTVGLRVPRVRYLCTSFDRRRFWSIRRGVPALHVVAERDGRSELTVSTVDAPALAGRLAG